MFIRDQNQPRTASCAAYLPLTAPPDGPSECPLGSEILHNHFWMCRTSRAKREWRTTRPRVLKSFANSNQDSRRKRDGKFSSFLDVRKRNVELFRSSEMRKAIAHHRVLTVPASTDAGIRFLNAPALRIHHRIGVRQSPCAPAPFAHCRA